MGKLEEANKKIVRRTKIQEAVLVTLASGGRKGATLLVPEVLNQLFNLDLPTSSRLGETVKSAASRLCRKGLVKFEHDHYSMTPTGKRVLDNWQLSSYQIKRPKKWDKKWRVIIFDIPERKGRQARNAMRWKLQKMGFFQLQKSVWVFPYPCEKEVQLISEVFKINPFVNIVTAEKIYNDNNLMEHFRLSV